MKAIPFLLALTALDLWVLTSLTVRLWTVTLPF